MFEHNGASKMRDMALAAAVGAGVLLGGAGFASAETESFIYDVGNNSPAQAEIQFNQFNPAFGTLTAVEISFQPYVEGSLFVSISGGEFGDSIDGSLQGSVALWRNGVGTPLFGGTLVASATCSVNTTFGSTCGENGAISFGSGSFTPNPVVLTDSESLSEFTGTGEVAMTVISESFQASFDYNPVMFSFGSGFASANAQVGGIVTVTYQFSNEPVATPEPGSLALLGAGLLGLAWRRRR